jgi:D-alanine-D-alanine ligase
LHGEFGEDGTVQAELEARGLPYSGTASSASRVAMDKVATKECLQRAGIATPAYEVVTRANLSGLASRFAVPAVVKPTDSGSSVDTRIVRTAEALREASADLVDKYGRALVETYIAGPELTVGILDDVALPVCEIRTRREFYDYQAKYLDEDTEYLFDLDLPAALLTRVQELSLKAFRALDCAVFARVDWLVEAATLEPYVLEINTIPGFTGHSLVPKAAARHGLDFDQLCQRIVELSLQRGRPQRQV